jgi:hypothetical protein
LPQRNIGAVEIFRKPVSTSICMPIRSMVAGICPLRSSGQAPRPSCDAVSPDLDSYQLSRDESHFRPRHTSARSSATARRPPAHPGGFSTFRLELNTSAFTNFIVRQKRSIAYVSNTESFLRRIYDFFRRGTFKMARVMASEIFSSLQVASSEEDIYWES